MSEQGQNVAAYGPVIDLNVKGNRTSKVKWQFHKGKFAWPSGGDSLEVSWYSYICMSMDGYILEV